MKDEMLRRVTRGQVDLLKRTERMSEDGERSSEEGSTTVEYSIGAVATAAFAGLLLAVLKSGGVKAMINNIIQTALSL